jgi:hypothetical protein
MTTDLERIQTRYDLELFEVLTGRQPTPDEAEAFVLGSYAGEFGLTLTHSIGVRLRSEVPADRLKKTLRNNGSLNRARRARGSTGATPSEDA